MYTFRGDKAVKVLGRQLFQNDLPSLGKGDCSKRNDFDPRWSKPFTFRDDRYIAEVWYAEKKQEVTKCVPLVKLSRKIYKDYLVSPF